MKKGLKIGIKKLSGPRLEGPKPLKGPSMKASGSRRVKVGKDAPRMTRVRFGKGGKT